MIIIVGGGLAGLSLGQGLKRAKIPFRIFERDTNASFRAQGYRIRIGEDGAAALKRLLPPQLFDAFEATSAEVVHGGHAVNAANGEELQFHIPGGRRPQHGNRAYNADRAVLRNLLLHGLTEVEFGKQLERYDVHGENEVIAHFADGSTARGDILLGADGVRSVVRRQLLPDFKVLDTEGRAIFGKTLWTERLSKEMPKQIGAGLTIAYKEDESRMKLFTDGMRFDRKQSVEFEDALGLEVPSDYIYWVLVLRKDMLSDDNTKLLSLSGQQSVEKSRELTASWHTSLRVLMDGKSYWSARALQNMTEQLERASGTPRVVS